MKIKALSILGLITSITLSYSINTSHSMQKQTRSKNPVQLFLYKKEASSAVASRVVSKVASEVTSEVTSEVASDQGVSEVASEVTSEVTSFIASPVISFIPTEKKDKRKGKRKRKKKLKKVTPIVIKQLEAMERIQNPEKYKISKRERAQLIKTYKSKK